MDLILFPFGGNAREAIIVINAINIINKTWVLIGFIDDNSDLWSKEFLGHEILGGKDKIAQYQTAKILAVPGRPDNYLRREHIINSLNLPATRFATLIHPSSQISNDTKIGYNTLIMAGVVTTSNVTIGNNCVILPNTVISHDSIIDDNCLLGSNVSISGGVHIERNCYIGSGSRIIQEITIKEKSLIGIGSVVLKTIEPNSVIVGNPGRLIRKVQ